MKAKGIPSVYAPIADQIVAARATRAVRIAEYIADLIVRGVQLLKNEMDAPARPAWIIVAERSKRSGEEYMRFAPR